MNTTPEIIKAIPPEMDVAEYAKLTGVSIHVIRGQIKRGLIPSFKRGRKRLVNSGKIFIENMNR